VRDSQNFIYDKYREKISRYISRYWFWDH